MAINERLNMKDPIYYVLWEQRVIHGAAGLNTAVWQFNKASFTIKNSAIDYCKSLGLTKQLENGIKVRNIELTQTIPVE
jgi:hypothetical protein